MLIIFICILFYILFIKKMLKSKHFRNKNLFFMGGYVKRINFLSAVRGKIGFLRVFAELKSQAALFRLGSARKIVEYRFLKRQAGFADSLRFVLF
jgi:hypothetical protein